MTLAIFCWFFEFLFKDMLMWVSSIRHRHLRQMETQCSKFGLVSENRGIEFERVTNKYSISRRKFLCELLDEKAMVFVLAKFPSKWNTCSFSFPDSAICEIVFGGHVWSVFWPGNYDRNLRKSTSLSPHFLEQVRFEALESVTMA